MIEKEQRPDHWRETRALMAALSGAVLGATAVLVLFCGYLNIFTVLDFPLGFYILAQGGLIVLVAVAYWFAARQERIDRRHGAMEDM